MAEDAWNQMINDLNSGKKVRIDREIFDYFLEVLPPVHMGYVAKFADGTERRVTFGFAEGAELVKAFWKENGDYYAQQTIEKNPYAFG